MTSTKISSGKRDAGRRDDADRRRQRVAHAITAAAVRTTECSVAAIARASGVHRSYLYRHPDLLALLHQAAASPSEHVTDDERVSHASLRADLAHAQARAARAETRIRQLEGSLSEALGHRVWAETGLEPVAELEQTQRKLEEAQQQLADVKAELDERTQDLEAARAANRELMTRINVNS